MPLIEFYFCIQSNSAECERGFSIMNIIKTKLRNLMEINTLDRLLRISTAEETRVNNISDEDPFDKWRDLKIRKSNLITKLFFNIIFYRL